MTSLYDLDSKYKALLYKEELTDADLAEIDSLSGLIEDKIVAYACVIQELKAKQMATLHAITHANDKLHRIMTNLEKIEKRVTDYFIANNMTHVDKHPLFDVRLRKNPISVDDYNRAEIPSEYWSKKEMLTVNKTKIREDIENLGLVIPGARLVNKLTLKIG